MIARSFARVLLAKNVKCSVAEGRWSAIVQYCTNMGEAKLANKSLFQGLSDRFNGVTVDSREEQCDENILDKKLSDSLQNWIDESKRAIWFKVDLQDSHWVPALANNGFKFHHARETFVMMYKWLPDAECNLPPCAHTNLGVGAVVLNDRNEVLVVCEKYYRDVPHWKLPGGYVDRGEDIVDAAIREVKEETGIDVEFESLVGFRHAHNMMFGNSDIYVVTSMKATTIDIAKCEREIDQCKWMDIDEYLEHPHVHAMNRMVVQKVLEYKNKRIKMDCEKITLQMGTMKREFHVYLVNDL